jgi:hypothetical protein
MDATLAGPVSLASMFMLPLRHPPGPHPAAAAPSPPAASPTLLQGVEPPVLGSGCQPLPQLPQHGVLLSMVSCTMQYSTAQHNTEV